MILASSFTRVVILIRRTELIQNKHQVIYSYWDARCDVRCDDCNYWMATREGELTGDGRNMREAISQTWILLLLLLLSVMEVRGEFCKTNQLKKTLPDENFPR